MALERGVLVVRPTGKGKPPRVQVRVATAVFNPARGEVSQSVLDRLGELDGREVEFELVGGQPKKIREIGGFFVPPWRQAKESEPGGGKHPTGGDFHSRRPEQRHDRGKRDMPQRQPDFHNPYNFVPAPPRNTGHPDLGDHPPVAQDAFLPDRYSGRIRVRMAVKTPLLVPDTEQAQESANGHKTYPLRVHSDGKPLIPASSIRGMLRSAYEIVTNSRFGRFSESHKEKLKFRQSTPPYHKVDFVASPWDVLHASLKPATTIDELSPADRVFGWVKMDAQAADVQSKSGPVAVRSLLRVGPVTCQSSVADGVESFPDPGVPLAILSTPKPQQGRFYVAKSQAGEAQDDGLPKDQAGYLPGKGLRGRKVYPHQASLPDGHWENPTQHRTQQRHGNSVHYQEYRRPQKNGQEQRDDQNRSILGWVKRGAQFTFELRVHNLSKVELGALLWLLRPSKDHFFRLGSGKPLGFGSVRLSIEERDLRIGRAILSRYTEWHTTQSPADPCDVTIQAFKDAVWAAYPPSHGGGFDKIPFIDAFLTAGRGFNDGLPIHYPRATTDGQPGPPSPDGESFRWFVANERQGARHALRDPATDPVLPPGLPTLEDRSGGGRPSGEQAGQARRRRGRQ